MFVIASAAKQSHFLNALISWYNCKMITSRSYRRLVLPFAILLITLGFLHYLVFHTPAVRAEDTAGRQALVITVDGIINPVSAEFITKSVEKAAAMKAEILVIRLDTPGGLETSMKSIVKEIMGSSVPVVVYVSPSGSRAASAGVFVVMSAHVAAMAPGTNIGAAHPVAVGEKMDKVMSEKAENDAAAYIKSIAAQTGRNAEWAEEAVRKSVSITETDALKKKVIDLVAKDLETLLKAIDGKKVRTSVSERVLDTAGIKVVAEEMGLRLKILDIIGDPNIAYILMLLGFYGLLFELMSPGAVLPGVVGAISMALALYGLQKLPVNYAGLALILIGMILFILEVKVTSYGALTIGGIFSVILGSIMLFDSPLPFFRVSLFIILPVVIVTALIFVLTVRMVYKAHRKRPVTGREGLKGLQGTVITDTGPAGGSVMVHGEIWSAWSEEPVSAGEKIVVESISGLKLKVIKSASD
jgi:membrane-bound serine protease (ClpP class)